MTWWRVQRRVGAGTWFGMVVCAIVVHGAGCRASIGLKKDGRAGVRAGFCNARRDFYSSCYTYCRCIPRNDIDSRPACLMPVPGTIEPLARCGKVVASNVTRLELTVYIHSVVRRRLLSLGGHNRRRGAAPVPRLFSSRACELRAHLGIHPDDGRALVLVSQHLETFGSNFL
jgi:hypothetical protein